MKIHDYTPYLWVNVLTLTSFNQFQNFVPGAPIFAPFSWSTLKITIMWNIITTLCSYLRVTVLTLTSFNQFQIFVPGAPIFAPFSWSLTLKITILWKFMASLLIYESMCSLWLVWSNFTILCPVRLYLPDDFGHLHLTYDFCETSSLHSLSTSKCAHFDEFQSISQFCAQSVRLYLPPFSWSSSLKMTIFIYLGQGSWIRFD